MLIVKDNGQNQFKEVTFGASFVGSDNALYSWQCIELWSDSELNAKGLYKVVPATPPIDPEVTVTGYHFERINGKIVQVLDLVQPTAPTKESLKAYAASKRYDKEIGGMVSPNFGSLLTDRETRDLMGLTVQSIDLGIVQVPINWKAPNGFISLDRATLLAISAEVVAYVQTAFDKEAEVVIKIDDGTITTKAEIDAVFAA